MLEHFDPAQEKDLGTPAVISDTLVELAIDGIPVQVPEGTSVLRAAALAGITIPKLCASDNLDAFGSCRLCAVQVEGRRGYPASCTTPAEDGMQVTTQNSKLAKLRRNIMELYISDHPLDCLTCPSNGDCELQDMAGAVGLREVRYGFDGHNHLDAEKDLSNPYFSFDPAKCIVCSRCVRACEEVQGTFALNVNGRGFDSKITAGNRDFMASDCVSCGACVQSCPTSTLMENSVIEQGQPERSVVTTCAYCGVGCSFKAELKGDQLVRMVPYKGGEANHGHGCVKGRFAFGYATHKDRIRTPMIRDSLDEPWREVSWEQAIEHTAARFKAIQAEHGRNSVSGITSSRCTNEETYLVQKLIRAAFGNNNTDTCARVCHSPTGYGLKQTLGESAGTQTFDSAMDADVIMVIGANPTDAHPVFGSVLRRRLRQGAKLIVADPRKIDLLKTASLGESQHLPLLPGTNVALINALAHVVISEGLEDQDFIAKRCDDEQYQQWREFILDEQNSPERMAAVTGLSAEAIRQAARTYANADNSAIFYGLGVTEHSQGSTMVMGIANLAMATGNIGRSGVGVNPLRGQNNVQGSCDMGSFPHELPGYQPVGDDQIRARFEQSWGVSLDPEPGMRIPNMFNAALEGSLKGMYVQGEDLAQSDPNTQHVEAALKALDFLVVQDIFLNETAKFAHVLLPGASFLEKDGTFTNAERRINRVRKVMPPLAGKADWEVTMDLSNALGYPMNYQHPSEIMDEIATLVPTFKGVSYDKLERLGSIQWPCNDENPDGMPIMHVEDFPIGKGRFVLTEFVPTTERCSRRFPLLLTTGRVLSQYNVGAQTRRTANQAWHDEDRLDIHPQDAEDRGINDGDWLGISSRAGDTVLRARISERMQPGVVYTTFHHPESGANVITTDNSDWATNCPEYKVTAVQVEKVSQPSRWQQEFRQLRERQSELLKRRKREPQQG
ncbi:formate dehydrogenase subunit alpha [Motiliproteus coralliicola]|uniref:Formate dehydrogenase subunit alpha n=1 Tax=Motiliproteus coralliicola TaxID=2283196 RepID=A0A369WBL1_9GAMM|nr:formate dehydrogenase subunit alpha [Motiliproteus coralliicola]RDE19398.1 formate dehydrogenase subunit alpha [Motiliproteus coralliicola]